MLSLNKATIIALFLCTFTIATSSTLNCSEISTEDCKAELSKLFDEAFKRIHTKSIKTYFSAYIQASRELASQLPQDEQWTKMVKETCNDLTADLKKLDEHMNDNLELIKIMNGSFFGVEPDMVDVKCVVNMTKFADKFEKVNEKYKLMQLLIETRANLISDVHNKWTEMYAGLRETDLKENDYYRELNVKMMASKNTNDLKEQTELFKVAIIAISEKLDVPYINLMLSSGLL